MSAVTKRDHAWAKGEFQKVKIRAPQRGAMFVEEALHFLSLPQRGIFVWTFTIECRRKIHSESGIPPLEKNIQRRISRFSEEVQNRV